MSPRCSLCQASPSSVMEEDVSRIPLCHASPSSVVEKDVYRILFLSGFSILRYERRMSPGSSLCHASPSSVACGGGCLQDSVTVAPLCPPLWRRMSPGSSHSHTSPSSIMEEDVSRILSLSRLSVLHYGGGCLQDPLTVTPLLPPLWRTMFPGSSHRHTSQSSVMKEDVSRILSLSRLSVLRYGGGCLQDPLTITPLGPPLWMRISPGSSHHHAPPSSVTEEDASRILSMSCLFVLHYGEGCLHDPLTVTPLCPPL
jgi:hypothetical protein